MISPGGGIGKGDSHSGGKGWGATTRDKEDGTRCFTQGKTSMSDCLLELQYWLCTELYVDLGTFQIRFYLPRYAVMCLYSSIGKNVWM